MVGHDIKNKAFITAFTDSSFLGTYKITKSNADNKTFKSGPSRGYKRQKHAKRKRQFWDVI